MTNNELIRNAALRIHQRMGISLPDAILKVKEHQMIAAALQEAKEAHDERLHANALDAVYGTHGQG